MRVITQAVRLSLFVLVLKASLSVAEAPPLWVENERVPQQGRSNPFELPEQERIDSFLRGRRHALNYPVDITGEVLPLEVTLRFLRPENSGHPLFKILERQFGALFRRPSFSQLEEMVGLQSYPPHEDDGVYHVPFPAQEQPWFKMGTSFINAPEGPAITFSCAACHAGELFGRKVIGLTNRFPRANEFFLNGRAAARLIPPQLFQAATQSTHAEVAMYQRLRDNSEFIDGRHPLVRGLDTSLAHVALSLSRRADDSFATKDPKFRRHPRDSILRSQPADSKPAVWWNVKYKNKWLLDGSVVAGNPIFTNILWNEIGRGTDLVELNQWLMRNPDVVKDLTTAVFSSQAPEFLDFFPEEHFSLELVRQGAELFNQHCASCHGVYRKGFELSGHAHMSQRELLKTVWVSYHENTPVIDVGTDPLRAQGMAALAEPLNKLSISQENGILVKVQRGYVPPPLVGVWARWPYMHNNSIPDLCSVLTPQNRRPRQWHVGEAHSKETDFDAVCNGYPLGDSTPSSWRKNRWGFFDTSRRGMSNQGHDEGIVSNNGVEKFSPEQKSALIQFLQTL